MVTPGNVSKEDLIYWAGLFDGEGCIKILKNNRSKKDIVGKPDKRAWKGVAEICGSHYPTLLEFWKTFGGSISCVNMNRNKWLPLYRSVLNQKQAEDFIRLVFPYLKIKKDQAINFIAFRDTFYHPYRHGSKRLDPKIEAVRWVHFDKARTLKRESFQPVTTEREKTCLNMKDVEVRRVMPQSELQGILTCREKLEAVSPSNLN